MTYRIVGVDLSTEPDTKVTAIWYFYDRSLRLWTITCHNAAGDQLDDTVYAVRKLDMMDDALRLARHYGLPAKAITRNDG